MRKTFRYFANKSEIFPLFRPSEHSIPLTAITNQNRFSRLQNHNSVQEVSKHGGVQCCWTPWLTMEPAVGFEPTTC